MNIEIIQSDMAEKAATIDPIGKKLKFILDEHVMLIDGTGDQNKVILEDAEADCTIKMSIEVYGKLQRKEIKPFMAAMSGKVKVDGDLAIAAKLKQLM